MSYWLVNFEGSCPSGWKHFETAKEKDCWKDGENDSFLKSVPPTIAELEGTTFKGTAGTKTTGLFCTGLCDEVKIVSLKQGEAAAANQDSILELAGKWEGEEWGIYGPGEGSELDLNSSTDLKLKTEVEPGSLHPVCSLEGYTGETNNLALQTSPLLTWSTSGTLPTNFEDEQSPVPSFGGCSSSVKWGDTHIHTFGCNATPSPPPCLLYDFQASGNFVAATTGPNFTVQTHQVSGAPTWPLAAVDQGVATKVGNDDVAVCAPQRLAVNGVTRELANGEHLNLEEQGEVSRYGNVYVIQQLSGNSVRAEVNAGSPSWINVSVGLREWPTRVRGLDASAAGNANAIETNGGTVLSFPLTLNEIYNLYGNSWRVPEGQSLLSACDENPISENPSRPFYASELEPAIGNPAREVCLRQGVQMPALLEACTLDVAVLGEGAAPAYREMPTDVNLGKILPNPLSFILENWVVSGALTLKKLNQPFTLPAGATFNGTAALNPQTLSGPLTGSVAIPPFNAVVKILGVPANIGLEFAEVGSVEGSIEQSRTLESPLRLSVPTKENISFTTIGILGLTMATKCQTTQALSLPLFAELSASELLATGAHFMGTTTIPAIKCEGSLAALESSVLTSLFSGPNNPYSITIAPPA